MIRSDKFIAAVVLSVWGLVETLRRLNGQRFGDAPARSRGCDPLS